VRFDLVSSVSPDECIDYRHFMLNNYHNLYTILTYLKRILATFAYVESFSVFVFCITVLYVSFGCTSQKISINFLN